MFALCPPIIRSSPQVATYCALCQSRGLECWHQNLHQWVVDMISRSQQSPSKYPHYQNLSQIIWHTTRHLSIWAKIYNHTQADIDISMCMSGKINTLIWFQRLSCKRLFMMGPTTVSNRCMNTGTGVQLLKDSILKATASERVLSAATFYIWLMSQTFWRFHTYITTRVKKVYSSKVHIFSKFILSCLHSSLALTFIYCRYISIFVKLITPQTSQSIARN